MKELKYEIGYQGKLKWFADVKEIIEFLNLYADFDLDTDATKELVNVLKKGEMLKLPDNCLIKAIQ